MADLIPEVVGAVIEAAVIYGGAEITAPIAGIAATAISSYLGGRLNCAKTILRSQLERAGLTASDFRDAEQFAAAAGRYIRAARDQAADENLRVLAQAMIGLARRHKLLASDFLKYAEVLAPLSRDELILLGTLMRVDADFHNIPSPPDSGPRVWIEVSNHLVANEFFPSPDHLAAVACQAQRSGLLIAISGFDGTTYRLSPLGHELREVVDINAVLEGRD